MAAPVYPVKTSATLPFGCEVLTIDAVNYIAENFRLSRGSVTAERQTELSAPNGFALNLAAATGTAQLQLPTSATAIPQVGHTFERGGVTYVITEVSEEKSQNGMTVLPITFREFI